MTNAKPCADELMDALVATKASATVSTDPTPSRLPTPAQVTPLPRVDDFHVGRVLGDVSGIVQATREDEESYIPVALARAHLARVVQDMHTMKDEQTATMNQILTRYKTIEAETKQYYENHVAELKRKAKEKFRVEQARFKALQTDYNETQRRADDKLRNVYEASDQRQREHEHQTARWRQEVETAFLRYEEELAQCHGRVEREIASAVQRQAETLSGSHAAELAGLQQNWEHARAESIRVVEHTKQALQQRLVETKAAYERQIVGLNCNADVEMETFKCVATVVNRIVEMDDHVRRRKRSRELKGEIEALAKRVEVSVATEQSLALQLSRLQAQYAAMEQRAVRQTLDVMIRTIELTPSTAAVMETAKPASDQAPPVVVPTKPLVVESEVQTNDWAALLAANMPIHIVIPPVETHDVSVETTPEEKLPNQTPPEVPALRLTEASATQLQYEADAERFRERNLELVHSKNELKSLKMHLQTCVEQKTGAKASIKQWLADFQKEHAREPTIDEKAQVKDLYLAFKGSEEAYNTAKERTATAKASHHALVVEVEALSQWHALAATTRGASRGDNERVERSASPATTQDPRLASSTIGALQEVETLAKEIDTLRTELAAVHAEKQKANDDVQAALLEATRAKTDAKATADRLVQAEAEALDAKRLAIEVAQRPEKKAEEKWTLEEREKRDDEERQRHRAQLESSAREAEAMARDRTALQASIASLRDDITACVAEKQALETQIEQLRLHVELMDGHDDDAASLLDSDAKDTSGGDEHDDEQEELDSEGTDAMLSTVPSPLKTITDTELTDGLKEAQLVAQIKDTIEAGKVQWNRGDKAKCFQLYVKMCEKCIDTLRTPPPGRRDEVAALKAALQEAGRLPPAKGSMVLRRQLDNCLAACEARADDLADRKAAISLSSARSTPASSPQRKSVHKKSIAPSFNASLSTEDKSGTTSATPAGGKVPDEYKQKLKTLETKAKADKVRITQLEASLSKAETQLQNASASSSGTGGGGATAVVLERKLADADKKHAKAMDEAEKLLKKEIATLAQQLTASQTTSQSLQEQADKLKTELTVVGGRATQLTKMEEEVTALRTKAAQVDTLHHDLTTIKGDLVKLEASYKEEQALRKKYYNMIEDMKGKIRVFARCRPMSSSETERGCDPCVRFVDEFSLELKTSHGPKTFAYDQVFTPASTQDQVFEDTKNLLQSAVDGYNVCIFAYGQTGSGKTFTMTGTEHLPGLSPRVIHHLFRLADESHANHTITFHASMLELYNDSLIDLLYLVDGGTHDVAPKLEIKKNERGMVFVSNSTTKTCTTAVQTLKLFDAANKKRQVGATKMNAESSRSHSVFSLLVENYNKTTKTTSIGKLSLVDLAGSERAGKTGATNDRLKEAQAINKSLSALGDVIAALSANEKFIPYRNNKLTQLMQDSLGGNAKTLMFVNISPADYNQEETQTSLQYAARVKLITNNANKTSESETVARLKQIIKQLKAGKTDVELEGLGLE